MIRLQRPEAPHLLSLPEVERMRDQVRRFYRRGADTRRQDRPDFPFFLDSAFKELLEALTAMSFGKCGYCESTITFSGNASLERFRPKAGAVGLNREFSSEHYWWLAYEWENLYAACATCNKVKGPKFPVQGRRAPVGATGERLASEQPLLLDPCMDDPQQHLEFQADGSVRPRSSRGEVTIETLELNRTDQVRERESVATHVREALAPLRRVKELVDFLDQLARRAFSTTGPKPQTSAIWWDTLRPLIDPTQVHAAVARSELRRWVAQRREPSSAAQELVTTSGLRLAVAQTVAEYGTKVREKKISAKARRYSTQTIIRVALKNYRGIRDLDLHIPGQTSSGAPWLILLGENGTGKSSILQAVVLTLIESSEDRSLGVTPEDVLRQGEKTGWVKVWIGQNTSPRVLKFVRGQRRFQREGPPFFPVLLGYGATRLLPRRQTRMPSGRVRMANMFDPFRPLLDANDWLGQLSDRSFDYAARALKDVLSLPASSRLRRVRRKGHRGVSLKLFGADLSLEQLSDGYQSVLGLTCDLMAGLKTTGTAALEAAEGLVALDELGAHLHPRWRMRIVTSLRKAFPRVQFLVSTHDPLCLRGLGDNEATVLRRTERGRIYPVPDLPPLKGLRVDQLLTSEFFGLDSTMDPAVEVKFRRLYYLLALRNPTRKQGEEVRTLREELAPHEIHGTTRREQRLLEILDRELARVDQESDPVKRAAIRRESEEQITQDLNMLLRPAPVAP